MAHKKGVGSSKNGRDSQGQRLEMAETLPGSELMQNQAMSMTTSKLPGTSMPSPKTSGISGRRSYSTGSQKRKRWLKQLILLFYPTSERYPIPSGRKLKL